MGELSRLRVGQAVGSGRTPLRRHSHAHVPSLPAANVNRPTVEDLFHAALALEGCDRGAYLDSACSEDPGMRAEVEALLATMTPAGGVLDRSPNAAEAAGLSTLPEDRGRLPERIDCYRILGLLGEGGMGTVYRAEHSDSGRSVALKVVRPEAISPTALRRFRYETEALSRLQHPGIARIFEAGTHETPRGPRPFFAMELVEGMPLDRYALDARLSLEERLRLFLQVCRAVDHAHRKGVLHRDLKPANVLVTPSGTPKVVDFGLARITEEDGGISTMHTQAGALLGTLRYMSPEQARNPTEVDARTDVYALGAIGFELLVGRLAHDLEGRGVIDAARVICTEEPMRLRHLRPELDEDLDAIFQRVLRRDPERRYPSAAAFAGDLEHFLAGGQLRATDAPPTRRRGLELLLVYAESDEGHVGRLSSQLEHLTIERLIRGQRRLSLDPMGAWRDQLAPGLSSADVVLLLVTPDLVASGILPALLAGGVDQDRLVALVVEACDWRRFAEGIPHLIPSSGEAIAEQVPAQAWTEAARALRGVLCGIEPRGGPSSRGASSSPSAPAEDLDALLAVIPGSTRGLVGREDEFTRLDTAYADQRVAVYGLVAFGGVGRTSLVHSWLRSTFEEASDVAFLGWSFHSQGTREQAGTSDQFLVCSLEALGDENPGEGSLWVRGRRLARLVSERRTVVVLDGIEPLQYEPGTDQAGQLKDAGLLGLLSELARDPGKAFTLVTSRVTLEGEFARHASVELNQLSVLEPEAAATLLRRRGVSGEEDELALAANYLGFHPLALVLAAEYQQTFGDGSAASIPAIPLLEPQLEHGRQAMAVMGAYEHALESEGEPLDAALLRTVGLFDRAVELDWLDALRQPPAIPGVTEELVNAGDRDLWESISRLRQWGLMLGGEQNIDTHPLIREYFGERLRAANEVGWRGAHQRLAEHLAATAAPFPESLRAMEPLLLAIVHGCKAGLPEVALRDVYFPRVQRGSVGFATNHLGGGGAVLGTLAHFFDRGRWGVFAEADEEGAAPLDTTGRLDVLCEAGVHLASIRSYAAPDAERCYALAQEICVERGEQQRLFRVLFGRWLGLMFRGMARPALELAGRILETAHSIGAPALLPAAHRAVSSSHFYRGEYTSALEHAEAGLAACDPAVVSESSRALTLEPSVSCLTYRGMSLWHAGYRERGLRHCDRAVDRAHRLGLAHSEAVALFLTAILHQWEGDVEGTLERAEQAARLSGEKGFHIWGKGGQILAAWARARAGQDPVESAATIERIVGTWGDNGEALLQPYWLLLEADVVRRGGRAREALGLLEQALALADATGEHWCDAEIARLNAVIFGSNAHGARWIGEARRIAEEQRSAPLLLRVHVTAEELERKA